MKMLDAMPARHPVNATLELTLRCNLKCKMCMFRHSDRENACLAAEELTSAQWADMAQQLFDAGTLNILITGGEPLQQYLSSGLSCDLVYKCYTGNTGDFADAAQIPAPPNRHHPLRWISAPPCHPAEKRDAANDW